MKKLKIICKSTFSNGFLYHCMASGKSLEFYLPQWI